MRGMTVVHHGTPGATLDDTGRSKYGIVGTVGANFERQVAEALHTWLDGRPETVHVFHDLSGLDTIGSRNTQSRSLNLGTSNIDHVILTGCGWIMLDAKGVGRGQLRVERGRGVLVTSSGQRRRQPWLDDGRAYSRAGALYDLTGDLTGTLVWVLPDEAQHDHPSLRTARCFRKGGVVLSRSELAHGDLEQLPELSVPYRPARAPDIERLRQHTSAA